MRQLLTYIVTSAFIGAFLSVPLVHADTAYEYVDIYGNIRTEVASTPTEAINQAELRDPDSGVMLVEENADLDEDLFK